MSKIVILAGGTRAESRNNMAASYVEEYLKQLEVPCSIYDQPVSYTHLTLPTKA